MAGQSFAGRMTSSRRGAVVLGVAAAVLAAVLLGLYITQYRSSLESNTAPTSVLVAKRLIPSGTSGAVVGAKQLYTITSVPKDSVKIGALTDPGLLNGQVAAVDIYPGQQLAATDFTPSGSSVGSSELKGSERSISIVIDPLRGSLATLQPGAKVDIYQQLSGASGSLVKLFRPNVAVLAASSEGGDPAEGGTTVGGATVILAVPARDVADFLYASEHTDLYFAIRPTSGATVTPPRVADRKTMLLYSRSH
jgi:Flp pilus assembly protein CpaB